MTFRTATGKNVGKSWITRTITRKGSLKKQAHINSTFFGKNYEF